MESKESAFSFTVYNSIEELQPDDAFLLEMAKQATALAYAPYSNFKVAAVARLKNGSYVKGTNQENASYPVGICAERVLLSAVASQFPGEKIETIAITYSNKNGDSSKPISPCGICRQTLSEFEDRQQKPIKLILGGLTGNVYTIEKASHLLPLSFGSNDLK